MPDFKSYLAFSAQKLGLAEELISAKSQINCLVLASILKNSEALDFPLNLNAQSLQQSLKKRYQGSTLSIDLAPLASTGTVEEHFYQETLGPDGLGEFDLSRLVFILDLEEFSERNLGFDNLELTDEMETLGELILFMEQKIPLD